MKRLILPIMAFSIIACDGPSKQPEGGNVNENGDIVVVDADSLSEAEEVKDTANAELWAYLYSHEFVSGDNTLTFFKDRAYVNDKRVFDALVVSDNDDSAYAMTGLYISNGRQVRLAVIRDENTRAVIDVTNPDQFVYYVEKEME